MPNDSVRYSESVAFGREVNIDEDWNGSVDFGREGKTKDWNGSVDFGREGKTEDWNGSVDLGRGGKTEDWNGSVDLGREGKMDGTCLGAEAFVSSCRVAAVTEG